MSEDRYCNLLLDKYYNCLDINMTVFGKKDGINMCNYLINFMKKYNCDTPQIQDENLEKIINNIYNDITDFR